MTKEKLIGIKAGLNLELENTRKMKAAGEKQKTQLLNALNEISLKEFGILHRIKQIDELLKEENDGKVSDGGGDGRKRSRSRNAGGKNLADK